MDKENMTSEEALDLDEIMQLIDMEPDKETLADQQPQAASEVITQPDEEPVNTKQKPKKMSPQKSLVMYLHDLVCLMVCIVLVFLLCFRIVIVSGDSMYNTLVDGDYLLLLSNVFYREPQAGDIIVASKESYDNGTPIIKRVIATEGQTVDIDFITGTVYVDGVALDEPYTYTKTNLDEGVSFPLTVEEGCIFVMGDNRNRSKDSRNPEIGLIDQRQIVGKAIVLIFPGTDAGTQDLDRIGVIG